MKEILPLLKKEFLLEWRSKYAINGILLYVVSTIFVCYLSFKRVEVRTWGVLFWIILLFAAVNAIAKSFSQENKARQLYYYTLARPQAIILAKIIYNTLLMLLLSGIALVVYVLFFKVMADNFLLFTLAVLLGGGSFAVMFTMISAIASKANNSATLMAVLGFPIIIPVLIVLMKLSNIALDGLDASLSYQHIGVLLLLNLMVALVSFLLFPYLWRE